MRPNPCVARQLRQPLAGRDDVRAAQHRDGIGRQRRQQLLQRRATAQHQPRRRMQRAQRGDRARRRRDRDPRIDVGAQHRSRRAAAASARSRRGRPAAVTRPSVASAHILQSRQREQAVAVHARRRDDAGDAGAAQCRGGAGADREPLLPIARAQRAAGALRRAHRRGAGEHDRGCSRVPRAGPRGSRRRRRAAIATATRPAPARRASPPRAAAARAARPGAARARSIRAVRGRRNWERAWTKAWHRCISMRCPGRTRRPLPGDAAGRGDAAAHRRIRRRLPAPAGAAGAPRQRQGLRVRRQPGVADDAGRHGAW